MKRATWRTRLLAGIGAVSLTAVAASCGAATGTGGSGGGADGGLPAKLVIATGDYKVPTHFRDEAGELAGLSIELARALGDRLGIEIELRAVPFDAVLAGISAGRYDAAIFNVSDTDERQQAVDFVDYALSGSVVVTRRGERGGITTDPLTLCGHGVALKAGQHEFQLLKDEVQPKCAGAGQAPIDIQTYKDDSSARFAVSSGRADALIGGATVTPYFVKQNSEKFELVGRLPFDSAPLGIPFDKGNKELVQAFLGALKEIYRDGIYQRIFDKWGLSSIMPEDASFFKINRGKGIGGGDAK